MRRLLCLSAAAATLVATNAARADDTADLEALLAEPVVSTASVAASDQSTAPGTSTTITADELRRYGIRTLAEAIQFLSLGMTIQQPLRGVEVGARGVLFTGDFGNHMLVMVNGHAVNEQWYGTAYTDRGAGIPMELVDRVEVVLGPGSVLYGSYAMLGVVNVVTKQAKDYQGVHVVGETELGARRESTTAGITRLGPGEMTSGRVGLGFGQTYELFGVRGEVTAAFEYYRQEGPAYRFGPQNVGNDAITGEPKRWAPGPGNGIWGGVVSRANWSEVPTGYVRATLGDFEVNARATLYRRGTPYENDVNVSATDFDEPRTHEVDRFLSIDVRHKATLSSKVALVTRVYADSYRYFLTRVVSAPDDCNLQVPGACTIHGTGISDWLGTEVRANVDWLDDGRLITTAGVDGRLRSLGSTSQKTITDTAVTYDDTPAIHRNDRTLGLYAQQLWRPNFVFGANLGVRSDVYEDFGAKTSPRAAVTVSPWQGATLKSVYAAAFRAPSLYESTYTETTAAPPALRPESVHSVEASFEQRVGTHRLMFGAFRSWWSDLILYQYDYTANVGSYGNFGSLDNYGFHVAYDGAFANGRFRYGLNATGARSRRTEGLTEQPLPVSPSVFGNARASYELGGRLPTIGLVGAFVGATLADRALDGGFTPTPRAPDRLVLSLTLTGPTGIQGLSYRVIGTYTTSSHAPYVVGPLQAATPAHPSAELAPVDTFRAAVGLSYDLK